MADGRKNSAASVRQRLKNLSLEKQRDFGLLLVNYGLERLIYRLSVSGYRDKFVLKGGMLVTLWAINDDRTTRDADFMPSRKNRPKGFRRRATKLTSCASASND